ncbi:MAG: multicopper oxidase domain-containing protein, partial [Aquisalimonadaceae bacterium]
MNRRQFLRLTGMSATGLLLPHTLLARNAGLDAAVLTLRPAPATVNLVGAYGDTDAWAYNGTVPGPEIRLAQGATLRASVENGLPQDTTVHWHGIRLPNA